MNEDAVAFLDAALRKRGGKRRDGLIDLAPGPGFVGPDEARAIAMAPRVFASAYRRGSSPAATF
jgi:hypothetical protein